MLVMARGDKPPSRIEPLLACSFGNDRFGLRGEGLYPPENLRRPEAIWIKQMAFLRLLTPENRFTGNAPPFGAVLKELSVLPVISH